MDNYSLEYPIQSNSPTSSDIDIPTEGATVAIELPIHPPAITAVDSEEIDTIPIQYDISYMSPKRIIVRKYTFKKG